MTKIDSVRTIPDAARWLGTAVVVSAAFVLAASAAWAVEFPGPAPGKATARLEGNRLVMENAALSITWDVGPGRRAMVEAADRMPGGAVRARGGELFTITLGDGRTLRASEMRADGPVKVSPILAEPKSVRAALRYPGWEAVVSLVSPDGRLAVVWRATLRQDANYVVQEIELRARDQDVAAKEVTLLSTEAPGARAAGEVDGSPVVAGRMFLACEHPMATGRVESGRVVCSLACHRPVSPKQPWTASVVIGTVPEGQLRRGFLYYLEQERARPYGLFVHYNSWWDIAWPDRKMDERTCLKVIEGFGRELTEKRGVKLDSFCFDDGWDDNRTLWRFHDGFPRGFTPLRTAAERYGSHLGVWLSPWGGYAQARDERLKYGATQGFETNDRGFSLAGPKYYDRFLDACAGMIRDFDVNYFKFDGIAQGISSGGAGVRYAADVAALLRLVTDLRRRRADLFINITTGTWPSPYWLWYGDSIWRNGEDVGFYGAGSVRQQSITYRDMITYRMIVRRAPLYPLNSLMIVSVLYAGLGTAAKMNLDVPDLVDEVRMGYAGGTQCLELYVTPQMLSAEAWDALAEATAWARANGDVLVDAHFIGGDPGKGEPYGYASWSPRKGILALRNPGGKAASLVLDIAAALELPQGAPREFVLASPWKKETQRPNVTLQAGRPHTLQLRPFETLVLEAAPVGR